MTSLALVLLLFLGLLASSIAESSTFHHPPGHKQPIGNHRPPELKYDEHFELSGELLFERYVQAKQPVILRNFARQWPAFTKWTDDYLRNNFGHLEVKLEPKRVGTNAGAEGALGIGRDTIRNFADTYRENSKYAVGQLPSPMYRDVLVAPCLTCGELADSLVEVDLWWSSGGTMSLLHSDAFNTFSCQLNGTKEWMAMNNNETDGVYVEPASKWQPGGLSPIDVDAVDLEEFPLFADVKYGIARIEAGDCFYMPGGKTYHSTLAPNWSLFNCTFLHLDRSQWLISSIFIHSVDSLSNLIWCTLI